jgi:hypothetical protein
MTAVDRGITGVDANGFPILCASATQVAASAELAPEDWHRMTLEDLERQEADAVTHLEHADLEVEMAADAAREHLEPKP